MLKVVNVIPNREYRDYNQFRQTTGLKFSILKKKSDDLFEELVTPFSCREFFSDIILATYCNVELMNFFGMEAVPFDVVDRVTYLSLNIERTRETTRLLSSFVKALRPIENKLRIKRTRLFSAKLMPIEYQYSTPLSSQHYFENSGYVLRISEHWIKCPFIFSVFSACLRTVLNAKPTFIVNSIDDCIEAVGHDDDSTDYSNKYAIDSASIKASTILLNSKAIMGKNPLSGFCDERVIATFSNEFDVEEQFKYNYNSNIIRYSRPVFHSTTGMASILDSLDYSPSTKIGAGWMAVLNKIRYRDK